MLEAATDRRVSDRRSVRGGGRRASDPPNAPSDLPACPACRTPGVALLAGESDGGWWFVCLACDHLWDQRLANVRPQPASSDERVARRQARVIA
jgi:hypothetical protein